jgi:hypothetical protein
MRQIIFNGDQEKECQLFSYLAPVFWQAAPAQTFDDLATASAVKAKLHAISEQTEAGDEFKRRLKPGEQRLLLRNTEWDYLKSHLTPPLARWPNSLADYAVEIIHRVREAEHVAEPEVPKKGE